MANKITTYQGKLLINGNSFQLIKKIIPDEPNTNPVNGEGWWDFAGKNLVVMVGPTPMIQNIFVGWKLYNSAGDLPILLGTVISNTSNTIYVAGEVGPGPEPTYISFSLEYILAEPKK